MKIRKENNRKLSLLFYNLDNLVTLLYQSALLLKKKPSKIENKLLLRIVRKKKNLSMN